MRCTLLLVRLLYTGTSQAAGFRVSHTFTAPATHLPIDRRAPRRQTELAKT